MSKMLTRTYSCRKHVRPIIDVDEEEDDKRRDLSGRKRVDVVQCLLDSSSDENNDDISIETPHNILWLTFKEICHIRHVLAQTTITSDKQNIEIRNGRICFRCRKLINKIFFLPFVHRLTKHVICYICQQNICKTCSYTNFHLPSSKLTIPIRVQTLMKFSSINIENKSDMKNQNNTSSSTVTICYDCLQVCNEHTRSSQEFKKPMMTFRRTSSLPQRLKIRSNETKKTRSPRRLTQSTNCKTEC